jgi:hypothetical protein
VALDEPEQILLWLARKAAAQCHALRGDALAFGGGLVGEQDVVGAGAVLRLGHGRLADQLCLGLVSGDRVAGVEEVLDPVTVMGAHVVRDPLGGGQHPRHDLAVDRTEPPVVLEDEPVTEAVGDHQGLGNEAAATPALSARGRQGGRCLSLSPGSRRVDARA